VSNWRFLDRGPRPRIFTLVPPLALTIKALSYLSWSRRGSLQKARAAEWRRLRTPTDERVLEGHRESRGPRRHSGRETEKGCYPPYPAPGLVDGRPCDHLLFRQPGHGGLAAGRVPIGEAYPRGFVTHSPDHAGDGARVTAERHPYGVKGAKTRISFSRSQVNQRLLTRLKVT
jgi:hypothetical protein